MINQDSEPEYSIKLLVLGDISVGKSSFIYRYIEDKFHVDSMTTTGLDLKTKDLIVNNKKIRIQLWDTAGQEKYKSITQNLILRVQGIIILFDITNKESFNNLSLWIKIIKDQCGHNLPILIAGNKKDLEANRLVKKEEINKFTNNEKIDYIETSCKTGENIKETIYIICKKIIASFSLKNDLSFSLNSSALTVTKKKKCC